MVDRLDHVHVEVVDRERAAAWFERVLALTPDPRFAAWSTDPRGPLFLTSASGEPCLALFEGETARQETGDHTVAFRSSCKGFLGFVERLGELGLEDRFGRPVTAESVVDHDLSWSLYFVGPEGHRFELTTYDYDEVARCLGKNS